MFEVINNLYLGSLAQLEAFTVCDNDVIVNCTKDLSYQRACGAFYRIAVDDDCSPESQQMMFESLVAIIPVLQTALKRGRRVLVHCKQGQQRSACVVAAYLMVASDADVSQAVEYVRSKNETPSFSRSISSQL